MKSLKFKLPKINYSRSFLNDEKDCTKITSNDIKKSFSLIKIPKNVLAINSKNYLSNRGNMYKIEASKQKNEAVESFMLKKISLKHYNLKPKYNSKKITSQNSTKYYEKIPNFNQSIDKIRIFDIKNKNKTNDMNLSMSNLFKIFSVKSDIKKVNNIKKQLIRDNENPSNGNELYNDTEEEKKESMTFFIDSNNTKTIIKKNLIKKNKLKKDILKAKPKVSEIFNVQSIKFIPFSYRNTRRKKSLKNIPEEKSKNGFNTFENKNYFKLNESKKDEFKSILRKKLRSLGQEMTYNKKSLKNINKEINFRLQKATNKLELFAKSIEESNIFNYEN